MSPRSKIIHHPDKEDIIEWLTSGVSVRDVEKRLKQRYPRKNQAHLRASASTIQGFKAKHLNLKGKVLEGIKEQKQLAEKLVKMHSAQEAVEATSAYKKAIARAAEEELNANEQLFKVFRIVESRIENLFNDISQQEFLNIDAEKLLQGYLKQFLSAFEQHKKYIDGINSDASGTNININIMNDQISILREAIRETLNEMDPEVAMEFMDRLNSKMRNLVYDTSGSYDGEFSN